MRLRHPRGEAEILAIVHNMGYPKGIGAVSTLNHFYNRNDIPLGAYKGAFGRNYSGKYVDDLVANFTSRVKNYSQVPEAVDTYLAVLEKQKDNSVVISSIGFLTNLRDLLQKKKGRELVEKKVKRIVVMGGMYPTSQLMFPGFAEFNFACAWGKMGKDNGCQNSAMAFMDLVPHSVELVFSGFGLGISVRTGGLNETCPSVQRPSNPCHRAYQDWTGKPYGNRMSWDAITTLFAVRGSAKKVHLEKRGTNEVNVVNKNGQNTFQHTEESDGKGRRKQFYLAFPEKVEERLSAVNALTQDIDNLLCAAPASSEA